MKRLITFLLALLLITLGASAQSTDVTETYIQNPSFETPTVSTLAGEEEADSRSSYPITSDELDGWTLTGTGSSEYQVCDIMTADATALDDNFSVPKAAAAGSQWLYVRNAWAGTGNASASVLQSVTLPAGNYKVSVDNMCISAATTYSVTLTVGDLASASLPINTATPEAWNTTSVKFTLEDETTLNIGVTISYGTTNASGLAVLLDNFKLYEVEGLELTAHECGTDIDHWEISGNTNGVFQYDDWSGTASTLTAPVLEYWIYNETGNLSAATISHNTLVGMPAGTYEVSIDASATAENTSGSVGTGTTFNANGVSVDMTTGTAGTRNYHGTYTVEATVGEEGTLDISFTIPSGVTYNWIAFQNLSVVMIADDYPTVAPLEGDMDEDVKEAMDAAIAAYEEDPSSATFNAAIDAIQDAYVAIQKYGEIHECEAEFDHWSSNPSIADDYFHANTWSTEADPSGMHNPFIEYWYGSGSALDDAVISHETITGTPGAIYSVSIDYRAFNENSTKVVSQGSTFNANETSADLCVGTRDIFNDVSEEEYAIGYTMLCQADENTGAIDINFTIKDADYDWLAFKNLIVKAFDGESWPELTAATGDMREGLADAQTAALSAYEATPSFETYLEAFNAVNAAHLSALFYEDIAETLAELDLDAAGQAAFSASENGAAYEAKTLEYCDMADIFLAAVKAQTTSGKDLTYVLDNTVYTAPYANTGTGFAGTYAYTGGVARESFTNKSNNGQYTSSDGKIIYQNIEGLVAGATYEIKFYAVANTAWNDSAASGNDIAQIFVNDITEDITVIAQVSCVPSNYSYTYEVTVGNDGVLEYGIQNVGDGGTWYVLQGVSLTLIDSGEISWAMTEAGWGTLILPFDVETVPDGLTLYAGDALTVSDSELTVGEAATTIAANTPYLVSGAEGTYSFTGAPANTADAYTVGMLTGTLVDMSLEDGDFTIDSGQYVLQNHEDEGLAFYPITSESEGVTLDAYHCYLIPGVTPNAVKLPGMATAIEAVESDVIANDAIYDLSGRRVAKAVKGVYIMNGKKVLVK